MLKFCKEIKGRLEVRTLFSKDYQTFKVSIANPTFRPVTILSYDILYAANDLYFQVVTTCELEKPVKVTESDSERFTVSREELIAAVKEHRIEQHFFHELKLRVQTSSSGSFVFNLPVPETIIEGDYYAPAGRFLATDAFLGFPYLASVYHRRGYMRVNK